MKAAGSTVNEQMKSLLRPMRYQFFRGWERRGKDWEPDELEIFLQHAGPRSYVNNHILNWPERVVQRYLARDWFLFSFYRHPGDQYCSMYHWSRGRPSERALSKQLVLDDYLAAAWTVEPNPDPRIINLRNNLDLPSYWRDLHYVDVFSDSAFETFGKYLVGAKIRDVPVHNKSANRGYQFYREQGEISDTTHQLLLNSQRYIDYQTLLEQPHRRDDASVLRNGKTQLAWPSSPEPNNDVIKFVIVFRSNLQWRYYAKI